MWVQSLNLQFWESLVIISNVISNPLLESATPTSLIPGLSTNIPPFSRIINSLWLVTCFPLFVLWLIVSVRIIDFPERLFNRVDFPTPEEPSIQYVLPFSIIAFILSYPSCDSLLSAIIGTLLIRAFIFSNISKVRCSSIKSILVSTIMGLTFDELQIVRYLSSLLILKSLSAACTNNA